MRSKSTSLTRVLVLDEDTPWRQALAGMYQSILGRQGEVRTAAEEAGAERQLLQQPVDVLSMDLSLSEAGDPGGTLLCDTGRLRLIDLAARRQRAAAVVLVIRSGADAKSRFMACDRAALDEAAVSPDEYLRRRFGDRGLVLHSPAGWDMATSIGRFEELIRRRLPDLARVGYTLRFGGTAYDQRVIIEAGRRTVAALVGADALLLAGLAIVARAGELLGDHSVLQIYRGAESTGASDSASVTRLAQREIDGLRRRLRNAGVNDRALIARVRKPTAGLPHANGAWRLDGSVTVEGMSSINVRARGGTAFRPDVPAVGKSEPCEPEA